MGANTSMTGIQNDLKRISTQKKVKRYPRLILSFDSFCCVFSAHVLLTQNSIDLVMKQQPVQCILLDFVQCVMGLASDLVSLNVNRHVGQNKHGWLRASGLHLINSCFN